MYTLYILLCSDKSLYTGITNNLQNRLKKHKEGKGSKYVRARLPFMLIFTEEHADRSAAQKRELQIHGWTRAQKINNLNLDIKTVE